MKKLFIIIVSAVLLTSCATIISGTTQAITFVSNPSGATVYDNGFPIGRTPIMAQLERSDSHLITIELAGYEPFQIVLRQEFNMWYLGNIIFGGIIGLIIDPITGAIYNLTPDYVGVDMTGAQTGGTQQQQQTQPQRQQQRQGNSDELVLDIVLVPVAPDAEGYQLVGQMTRK